MFFLRNRQKAELTLTSEEKTREIKGKMADFLDRQNQNGPKITQKLAKTALKNPSGSRREAWRVFQMRQISLVVGSF